MKKTIRLSESDLHRVIKESVKRALNETELYYDVDNFSGKHYKNPQYDEVDPTGYLDDPNNPPGSGEDWDGWSEYVDDFNGDEKAAEEDYSWHLHDNQPIAPGLDDFYNVGKRGVERDVDQAIKKNNRRLYGDEAKKDRIGARERRRWLNGADDETMLDFDETHRDLHPDVYGESKLRSIVRESVKRTLMEWQFDNDLDYERIYDNACDFLSGNHGLTRYGWREIAEEMGFRMDSIGPNDMETLKDAIEDAMYEIDAPATEKADVDFEYDIRK